MHCQLNYAQHCLMAGSIKKSLKWKSSYTISSKWAESIGVSLNHKVAERTKHNVESGVMVLCG